MEDKYWIERRWIKGDLLKKIYDSKTVWFQSSIVSWKSMLTCDSKANKNIHDIPKWIILKIWQWFESKINFNK